LRDPANAAKDRGIAGVAMIAAVNLGRINPNRGVRMARSSDFALDVEGEIMLVALAATF
jgi:hypothetical protein